MEAKPPEDESFLAFKGHMEVAKLPFSPYFATAVAFISFTMCLA